MEFQRLKLPPWITNGIRPNDQGARSDYKIIGADSETVEGLPLSFQFHGETSDAETAFVSTSAKSASTDFIAYLDGLPNGKYLVYAVNLVFDIVSFFYDVNHKLDEHDGKFDFTIDDKRVRGIYNCGFACATITFPSKRKSIRLIDISAFFPHSAANLAKLFCPDLPKLKKPRKLGERRFRKSDPDWWDFYHYAMRDAEICYHVGKAIFDFHLQYDVRPTISIAQLAAKIFRHKFLIHPIPFPYRRMIYAALYSYHGGKNTITKPRGIYKDVYLLDINSAYPYAMSRFPSFALMECYKSYTAYGNIDKVPEFGIYCIRGRLKKCTYPIFKDHIGNDLHGGSLDGIYVTGFELNEALRTREVELRTVRGFFYDSEADKLESPFKAYVNYFYTKRKETTDKVHNLFYKILLNSLYGKFIQTVKKDEGEYYCMDTDEITLERTLEAGGLFHPIIASLITGHTRAYLHRLEHEYQAIHSSTDGIMTFREPETIDGLGGISVDGYGDLMLIRNKLYILYCKQKRIRLKVALHGFHGTPAQLEACMRFGRLDYTVTRPAKLRQARRLGKVPNKFEKLNMRLIL